MKTFFLCIVLFLFASQSVYTVPVKKGWNKFKQPNGTTFIARQEGDEFYMYSVTKDGAYFVQDYKTGWFYYAVQQLDGKFISTDGRVGIDSPSPLSKQFDETIMRRAIEQERKQYVNMHTYNKNNFAKTMTVDIRTVRVLIVEFSDVTHTVNTGHPNGYYTTEFERMMFSVNQYYGISPDGLDVFGSVSDYYHEMTLNNVDIQGSVINKKNSPTDSIPIWIKLSHTKNYYQSSDYTVFLNEVLDSAENSIPGFDRDDYHVDHSLKLAIIYAGDSYFSGGLHPRTEQYGYFTSETYAGNFSHIGVHCHEIGHALFNFLDLYGNGNYVQPHKENLGQHCLMADGVWNGPSPRIGQAPAPINPILRFIKGWYSNVITLGISQALTNQNVSDNNSAPTFYRIMTLRSDTSVYGAYYLIENRQKTSYYDKYSPYSNSDSEEGLLVWQKSTGDPYSSFDLIERDDSQNDTADYFSGNSSGSPTNFSVFCGEGGGGFVVNSKSGSSSNYTYNVSFFGDGSQLSGTYSNAMYLSGNVICDGVVFNNKVFAMAGTVFKSNSSKAITFSNGGYFLSAATSAYPVVFQANGSTWSGLVFSDTATSNTVLKYCTVQNVLTYGGSAISVANTPGITINHCTISNNVNYGTSGISFVNAGSPNVSYNTISNNGSYALKYQNTSGYIWANIFQSNTSGGIYLYNASPNFGYTGFSAYNGNNLITDGYYGINAVNYSYPYVGSQYSSYFGYNLIYNNSTARVNATSHSEVWAEQNWWGSSSPSSSWFQKDTYSTIDYFLYLTSPPVQQQSIDLQKKYAEQSKSTFAKKSGNNIRTIALNGDFKSVSELLKSIVQNATDTDLLDETFAEFSTLLQLFPENMFIQELLPIFKNKTYQTNFSKINLARLYSFSGERSYAQQLFQEIKQNESEISNLIFVGLNEFYDNLFHNDFDKAKNNLSELNGYLKDDSEVKEASWLFGVLSNVNGKSKGEQIVLNNKTNSEIILENYPNPFNPATTISYTVPISDNVKIIIYDYISRIVVTLVNEFKNEGRYDVAFDASRFSSGMYFCRLQAGNKISVKKMLLLK